MNILGRILIFLIFLGIGYGYNYYTKRDIDYNNMGVDLYDESKYKLAIKQYDKSLEIKPKEALYNYNKALALFYLKDYNRALVFFDNSINYETKKDNELLADNYSKRGATYYELFKDTEALSDIDKSLSLNPNDLWGLYYKSAIIASSYNYTGALDYMIKYIELDKTNPDAYALHGDILYYLGRTAESNEAYLKSLELNNNSYLVNFNTATNYLILEEYSLSLEYYQKALKFEPDNYLNSFYVGYSSYKLGNFEDASEYVDKSYLLEGGKDDELVKMYKVYLLNKVNNQKEVDIFLNENYKGIKIGDINGLIEIFENDGYDEFIEALEIYKLK